MGEKNQSVEKMLQMADRLNIGENIVFSGWIKHSEIKYAYGSSDVVLVLSQYIDPFPTLNLEAMASKKPVIGTVMGGTKEIVIDDKTGYIINPKDIDEVSKKILDLLENKERASAYGLNGFRRVSEKFSIDDWADRTLLCYAEAFDIIKQGHER